MATWPLNPGANFDGGGGGRVFKNRRATAACACPPAEIDPPLKVAGHLAKAGRDPAIATELAEGPPPQG